MDGQTDGLQRKREREKQTLFKVSNITENPGISQSDCFEENNTREITCICFINILKTFTFLSLVVTMFESSIGKKIPIEKLFSLTNLS